MIARSLCRVSNKSINHTYFPDETKKKKRKRKHKNRRKAHWNLLRKNLNQIKKRKEEKSCVHVQTRFANTHRKRGRGRVRVTLEWITNKHHETAYEQLKLNKEKEWKTVKYDTKWKKEQCRHYSFIRE